MCRPPPCGHAAEDAARAANQRDEVTAQLAGICGPETFDYLYDVDGGSVDALHNGAGNFVAAIWELANTNRDSAVAIISLRCLVVVSLRINSHSPSSGCGGLSSGNTARHLISDNTLQ
jgi:hypothetical protein